MVAGARGRGAAGPARHGARARRTAGPMAALLALSAVGAPAASEEPAAAQAPAQRPAILGNRWQEDWSALADPALRSAPLDRLKYLPLGGDGRRWLSFGANLRLRYESSQAPALGAGGRAGDTWWLRRLEAHADARLGALQLFVQLQDDAAPGKRDPGAADRDRLDVEQAFVAWVRPGARGTVKLRAGRQQFAFDLQRFVSLREGANVRQSFDALWGEYETAHWRWIAYATQPVQVRDSHAFDDTSSPALRFDGVRVERKVLGEGELSAYWSRYQRQQASYPSVAGRERRDVWDLRFAGQAGALDWDNELMLQGGRVGGQRVRAWALGARAGHTFASALAPRLGLQLDAASGDRDPGDATLGTFNPLFPNGAYLNLAGYTGQANVVHIKPSLTLVPRPGVSVLVALAGQWRATTADAVYVQPAVPLAGTAGRGRRRTGGYAQLRLDWRLDANAAAAVEAVHFQPAGWLRADGAGTSDYLGVELRLGW